MPIKDLNHFFIRALDLEATKEFFVDTLGFEVMQRPNFPFPGYWLGVNGSIQVHIGPSGIPDRQHYYLGTPEDAVDGQTGVIDHVAFLADDPAAFIKRLDAKGVSYRPRHLPDSNLFQLFLRDPNGVMIELNFFGVADVSAFGGENYSEMTRVSAS
jgi:catechol 2,3-dioxygenase-like lactoylglutathione lyase family enzyme